MKSVYIKTIINELKHLNEEQIKAVYNIIHKYYNKIEKKINKNKILKFAGVWKNFNTKELIDDIYNRRLIESDRRIDFE